MYYSRFQYNRCVPDERPAAFSQGQATFRNTYSTIYEKNTELERDDFFLFKRYDLNV